MRLRSRFEETVKERVGQFLPDALETVWDQIGVTAAIEGIKFQSVGGIVQGEKDEADWEYQAHFSGVLVVELRADGIDDLVMEPLLADLVTNPVFVPLDTMTDIDAVSEKVRGVLTELRDALRATQVVSALRFAVTGSIMRRAHKADAPALFLGEAPNIGFGHEDDYFRIQDLDDLAEAFS
jgi:hypothetical protein